MTNNDNTEYDFYFSKTGKVEGSFKGKLFTEKVLKGKCPAHKPDDLIFLGTGTMTNTSHYWRA